MHDTTRAPEASLLRLSRYHCFAGELLRSEEVSRITSREMSEQLGVAEETVRRDLAYIELDGRPGAGYDPSLLYEALEDYLGLRDSHAFAAVGPASVLEALALIFPAAEFGLVPAAYYSERPEDAGRVVGGVEVRPLAELPDIDADLGVAVGLVACEPEHVQSALETLDQAGIHSVLMLTPTLRTKRPHNMEITYFRIPCAMKALVGAAPRPKKCCSDGRCEGTARPLRP